MSYIKHTWTAGETITSAKLNTIEEGITTKQDELSSFGETQNIRTINNVSLVGQGNITIDKDTLELNNVDNTSDLNKPVSTATKSALTTKQDLLTSGVNIKTINSTSILGPGDLIIEGVTSYSDLNNKPAVNSVELIGNKTLTDLGIPTKQSELINDDSTVKDISYVHTDNNYTSFDKEQLDTCLVKSHSHSNKAILDNTTASYLQAEKEKLSNIEAGAQVNTVQSVAGKTGAVILTKADVALPNVDNTSDLNKPISTLQATKNTALEKAISANAANLSAEITRATEVEATKQDKLTTASGIFIDTNNNISNTGVLSITSGVANGTISVNTNGSSAEVAIKGLGTNAYTSTTYAPSDSVYTKTQVDASINNEVLTRQNADSLLQTNIDAKANNSEVVHTTGDESISGLKTFLAPSNTSGEDVTTWFTTSNGGRIGFGKEEGNSGSGIFLEQTSGTRRLNFRASAAQGAMVWAQPEPSSTLVFDVDTINFRGADIAINNTGIDLAGSNMHLGTSSANWSSVYAQSIYEGNSLLSSKYAPILHAHAFSTLTDKPTTISGYGITDSYTKTDINSLLSTKQDSSQKGTVNGYASLDATGRVPASQLPAYVDDVLEFASLSAFPATGETGKIYIAIDTNLTYRWSGSAYVLISSSLALGETSSTAYAGDKGAAVTTGLATEITNRQTADTAISSSLDSHINNISNPHSVTSAQVGLGAVINTGDSSTPSENGTTKFTTGGAFALKALIDSKTDTTYSFTGGTNQFTVTPSGGSIQTVSITPSIAVATTSVNGLLSKEDKTKLDTIASGAQVNSVYSVAGKTGDVTLTKTDVALGNVDNTSDLNKPISTATQTALDTKQSTLVSGTNIKTINSTSLLGSGNITISSPTKTSDLDNDSGFQNATQVNALIETYLTTNAYSGSSTNL